MKYMLENKELECLEKFKSLYKTMCKNPVNIIGFDMCYITIKQSLTTKSKKEQAFDIVKDCFSVGEYKKGHYHLINECSDCRESMGDISKEEYDLLKEVLK